MSVCAVRGGWSADEDDLILEKQAQLGNRWSEIAKLLTGGSLGDTDPHVSATYRPIYWYLQAAPSIRSRTASTR